LVSLEGFGQAAPSIEVDFTNVVRAVGTLTFGQAWRKDPSETALAAPELIGTIAIVNGSFSYTLTPYSVTVFVLPVVEGQGTGVHRFRRP
jgi:hypothetical protein